MKEWWRITGEGRKQITLFPEAILQKIIQLESAAGLVLVKNPTSCFLLAIISRENTLGKNENQLAQISRQPLIFPFNGPTFR